MYLPTTPVACLAAYIPNANKVIPAAYIEVTEIDFNAKNQAALCLFLLTALVTRSQSEINVLIPVPKTLPAVLNYMYYCYIRIFLQIKNSSEPTLLTPVLSAFVLKLQLLFAPNECLDFHVQF